MYWTSLRKLHVFMLLALLGSCAHPVPSTRGLQSKFAQVAPATRLHFIDFGGKGEPVILLAGPGNTAWIYAAFGKDLANEFHVLALTRRGHGESDMPATGYDQATLVEDLRGFLDSQRLDNVHLVGSATAGEELTRFASKYPSRVSSLIYLDAAYDRSIDVENGTPPITRRRPTRFQWTLMSLTSSERGVSPMPLPECWSEIGEPRWQLSQTALQG